MESDLISRKHFPLLNDTANAFAPSQSTFPVSPVFILYEHVIYGGQNTMTYINVVIL